MPRPQSRKTAPPDRLTYPQLLATESLPPPPRQERSRRTREALIRAALSTFEKHGYEATTIEEIARVSKVAVGGFYLHFRTKRQALLVLMDQFLAELATLELPADTVLGAPAAKAFVVALVHVALRVDLKYWGAFRAWHEAVLRDEALAKLQAQIDAWTTERIVAMLHVVRRAPNVRRDTDAATLARVLNALFWRLTEMRAGEEKAVVRATVAMVTHAIFTD